MRAVGAGSEEAEQEGEVLDVFSRYAVGWMVAEDENAAHASQPDEEPGPGDAAGAAGPCRALNPPRRCVRRRAG